MIKSNFDTIEKSKNDIFKQIKDLNNSLTSNNIVGTPFVKEILSEDSINSKVLNDISKKWKIDKRFSPNIDKLSRIKLLKGWKQAIKRTLV